MPASGAAPSAAAVAARAQLSREELLDFYRGKIAKWWTPDDVVFVEAIPLGATGKMLKSKLREQFREYNLHRSIEGGAGHGST